MIRAGACYAKEELAFIFDVDSQFPDSLDRDFFLVLFVAIDGQKQIRYLSRQKLHHEPVFASGDKMVDPQMFFPPAEKDFDIPPQPIYLC